VADSGTLAKELDPWVAAFQLRTGEFTLIGDGAITVDNQSQRAAFKLVRRSDSDFDLTIEASDYAMLLVRRAETTVLSLPKHRKVFWGTGPVDPKDHLDSGEIGRRIVRATSEIAIPYDLMRVLDASALAEIILSSKQGGQGENPRQWKLGETTATFRSNEQDGFGLQIQGDGFDIGLRLSKGSHEFYPRDAGASMDAWLHTHWKDFQHQEIPRAELERTMVRGLRRASEVLAPSDRLKDPTQRNRSVANGELRWIEGQRVALLYGTPEEIGTAHAELLRHEAMRCVDSVLYGFGLAQTIANGRWFRDDLERAYEQLKPHIPERHIAETRALARGLELDERLVEALNVFPELFHCSGFAVFGSATEGGKLYHGRVLDYMTTIGLQDAATTFIVAPEGQIPFVNVGYAGFTGSVSGMNAEKISLGEMGGQGQEQWNGVPMATLMRRALEECDSLDSVKRLWETSPRTCEYFYVFADGEEKTAVGVAATPTSIEFTAPGQSHPLLGEGIPDAVVLSAGSRLEELRRRITELHGTIDASKGTELMCRPVAMSSNLHNVLFVPEDGELYIANASHAQPAADRPYVRLHFLQLLEELQQRRDVTHAQVNAAAWEARDTLAVNLNDETVEDAKDCLTSLCWEQTTFPVRLGGVPKDQQPSGCDDIVQFPSPISTGDPKNDMVAMEWYRAKKSGRAPAMAPAVVVIHESGRGMTVGRLIARGLSKKGVHAFMMQLPSYGLRRGTKDPKSESELMIQGLRQGIADARRAYDAVRVLPGVDRNRVSIQGTSLGGFVVATTTGLDSAYHRSIILLAGGDLFSVLAQGDRDAARTRRELEQRGIPIEGIRDALYTIEPLRLAHRVSASRTWLFSGSHDTVVPPASSKAFADAAKLPAEHHIEMPADHYSGIVFLPSVIQQIVGIISE